MTLHVPYFKQGDDLAHHLEKNKENVLDSLEDYWIQISSAAQTIHKTREIIKKHEKSLKDVNIDAQTHMIWIDGPNKIIDELIKEGLGEEDICDCEDCE